MYWDPFDEISRMHEEMDRLFGRALTRDTPLVGYQGSRDVAKSNVLRMPVVDVKETESGVLADIELPGADKKDIDLNITEDSIEVRAQKKEEKQQEKKGVYSYSSSTSQFYRKVPLPVDVDADKAKASYKNGILHIEVPKLKQLERKKRLQIE